MRKLIFVLLLFFFASCLIADNKVKFRTAQDIVFDGQILYTTDSLMYIWTGLNDFNQANLQYVIALPFSTIESIKLGKALSWGQGIKKLLPLTFGASTVIVISNFKNEPIGGILAFMSLFNLMFAVPGGALVSLGSHAFVNGVDCPSPQDFDYISGKYKKYVLLTSVDVEIIEKLITEVKP